eukprot:jgi/Ulvmu1/4620/UM002_0350.1
MHGSTSDQRPPMSGPNGQAPALWPGPPAHASPSRGSPVRPPRQPDQFPHHNPYNSQPQSAGPYPGLSIGAPPLPRPWTAHISPTGTTYYYNHVTQESTWLLPQSVPPSPQPYPPPPRPSATTTTPGATPIPGTPWQRVTQPDGRQYFSNVATNETSWTLPPGVAHLAPPTSAAPRMRPQPPLHGTQEAAQAPNAAGVPPGSSPSGTVPPLAPPPPPQHPRLAAPPMAVRPRPAVPNGVPPAMAMWRPWIGAGAGGPPRHDHEAAAKAAAEAAEAAQRKFRQMLAEHEVNEFSRWEKASKKFDSDPRFKAVPAKERKALFNTFCANAVEERTKVEAEAKEHAVRGLHELFAELLGVTPLQFRLFREGKDLVDVELEVAAEAQRRAEALRAFAAEEGEEPEEGEAPAVGAGAQAQAALAAEALDADLEMTAGGLFVPGMTVEVVGEMVPKDPRWLEAGEDTRREVFEEVAAPVVRAREEADVALAERMRQETEGWLRGAPEGADVAWEQVDAAREGLAALLPERIARKVFDQRMEELRARKEERERTASAAASREAERRRRQAAEKSGEQRQLEASRAVDEQAFRTLLAEAVKDPSRTWREARDKLEVDVLRRMSSQLLTQEDYRGLFDAHVAALATTARKQYLAALEQAVRPAVVDAQGVPRPASERGEVARSWEAAAEVLAVKPCFQKLAPQEREATWAAFVRDTAAGLVPGLKGAPGPPAAERGRAPGGKAADTSNRSERGRDRDYDWKGAERETKRSRR